MNRIGWLWIELEMGPSDVSVPDFGDDGWMDGEMIVGWWVDFDGKPVLGWATREQDDWWMRGLIGFNSRNGEVICRAC